VSVLLGVVGVLAAPEPVVPGSIVLGRPFPNPSTTGWTVRYTLPRSGAVSLRVYDLLGRHVATLADGNVPAGEHLARWDGRTRHGGRAAPGLYLIRLTAGDERSEARGILLH
jgi:hypothetical protein